MTNYCVISLLQDLIEKWFHVEKPRLISDGQQLQLKNCLFIIKTQ